MSAAAVAAMTDRADAYELSPMQEVMLFHALHSPDSGTNFNQLSCRIRGDLEPTRFRETWQRLVDRHCVLRTSFHWEDLEKPLQAVHSNVKLPWFQDDWRGVPDAEQRVRWNNFLERDRAAGFVLDRAPLLRCKLVCVADDEYLFNWSHHHILSDGWCIALVMEEVFRVYGHLTRGLSLTLPTVRPYRDYIQWLQRQSPEAAREYWTRYLKGLRSATPLPAGTQSDERFGAATTQIQLELTEGVSAQLRDFAARHGLTLNTLVQGAWALVLARYSGETDIVFGTTVAGRPTDIPGIETMVGNFINTVPARVHVDPKQPLVLWLKMIQARMAARNPFEHTRLLEIQQCSEVPLSTPLYESNVIFMNYPLDESLAQGAQGLIIDELSLYDRAHVPLDLRVTAQARWKVELAFDGQRFDPATIHRMLGHVTTALENFPLDPVQPLGRLSILTANERRQILEEFNDTDIPFDASDTIVHRLQKIATEAPHRIAVECNGVTLSAHELNARANRLARRLLSTASLRPDDIVAVCAHRSERMVEAILAIWKCGAAYVPIDPDYPAARIRTVLEDARAKIIITTAGILDAELAAITAVVTLDDPTRTHDEDASNLNLPIAPDSLAYVIYTSGSTGKPKGAMVEHAGMLNHMLAKVDELSIGPSSVIAQNASQCFDVSVWQFFSGPLLGGKTVIFDNHLVLDPLRFLPRLQASRVDILEVVPSFLALLLERPPSERAALGSLKVLVITGEMLNPALLDSWFSFFPDIPAVNAYGPAEAADDVTHHRIERAPATPYVPIGKPVRNIKLYVTDPRMNLCPIGIAGEICVSGIGVGRGYLNNEAATAAAFLQNPFQSQPGVRLYRTGDTGCFLPDGTLLMLGRKDHQVKIRGRRIELGEIEAAIARLPGITNAVVVAREDARGNRNLFGYAAGTGWTASEMRNALRECIPAYMVPDFMMLVPELPVNSNGKIDRAALPLPEAPSGSSEIAALPHQTAMEAALARIFSEVLARESIGIDDGFFDLGGHSFKAIQMLSRIRGELSLEVSIADIFSASTVRALAKKLEHARAVTEELIPALPSRSWYVASHAQKRIWLASRNAGASYNMPSALQIEGSLHVEGLIRALEALVDRHESLRTVFALAEGELQQKILSRVESGFQVERAAVAGELEEIVRQEADRPFDLAVGPLFRAKLIELSRETHALLLTLHHIVADVWSTRILTDELRALYAGQDLPPLSIQYRDYAEWHQAYLTSEQAQAHRTFWLKTLAPPVPRLPFPVDYPRPERLTYAGRGLELELTNSRVAGLTALARAHQTSLYTVVLSSICVLLHRCTGSEDIVIGSVSAGRGRKQLEAQIGVFLNTVALRIPLQKSMTVDQAIEAVARASSQALEHADYPFDLLLEQLKIRTPATHFPLFDIQVDYIPAFETRPDSRLTDLSPTEVTSKFDLTFYITEEPDRLLIRFIYNTSLFRPETLATLRERLVRVQEVFLDDPQTRIDRISLPPKGGPRGREIRVGLRLNGRVSEPSGKES